MPLRTRLLMTISPNLIEKHADELAQLDSRQRPSPTASPRLRSSSRHRVLSLLRRLGLQAQEKLPSPADLHHTKH